MKATLFKALPYNSPIIATNLVLLAFPHCLSKLLDLECFMPNNFVNSKLGVLSHSYRLVLRRLRQEKVTSSRSAQDIPEVPDHSNVLCQILSQ